MTTMTTGKSGSHSGRARARRLTGRIRLCLNVLSAIGTVLLAIVASLLLVISVASHLAPRNQYTAFGHPLLTVLSGSMSPVIRTGDLIVDDQVTAAQAEHLRPGQIISFLAAPGSTKIITHRIVARKIVHGLVEYQTKGDANDGPDGTLRPAKDVVGVFRASIRGGGYLISALHRPVVPVLLAVSVALFFLAGPLFRLAREMDEREASITN
jgi:signal peptidase I